MGKKTTTLRSQYFCRTIHSCCSIHDTLMAGPAKSGISGCHARHGSRKVWNCKFIYACSPDTFLKLGTWENPSQVYFQAKRWALPDYDLLNYKWTCSTQSSPVPIHKILLCFKRLQQWQRKVSWISDGKRLFELEECWDWITELIRSTIWDIKHCCSTFLSYFGKVVVILTAIGYFSKELTKRIDNSSTCSGVVCHCIHFT